MKKIFTLCLVVALTLALVGCGKKDEVINDNELPVQSGENIELSGDNELDTEIESGENTWGGITDISGENDSEIKDENNEEVVKPIEPEDKPVVEDPIEKPEEKPVTSTVSAADVMTKLIEKANIQVRMAMQVEIPLEMSEAWLGLKSENYTAYVTDTVMYESGISPANESFCIIKVKDASKVEELKKEIFDNCNPRKWICMGAERVVVLNSGEYIMLAMASQDSCNALIPVFKAEFGEANVGTILDKTVEESIENVEDLPGGGMAL